MKNQVNQYKDKERKQQQYYRNTHMKSLPLMVKVSEGVIDEKEVGSDWRGTS